MVTISAVVFLYSPQTQLASVAILALDEAGEIGPAAAMATLIVMASHDGMHSLRGDHAAAADPHAGNGESR